MPRPMPLVEPVTRAVPVQGGGLVRRTGRRLVGVALAAVIGIPGLGFYLLGRQGQVAQWGALIVGLIAAAGIRIWDVHQQDLLVGMFHSETDAHNYKAELECQERQRSAEMTES